VAAVTDRAGENCTARNFVISFILFKFKR
jgi:hypothetical protein